jgi:hypothetical protein
MACVSLPLNNTNVIIAARICVYFGVFSNHSLSKLKSTMRNLRECENSLTRNFSRDMPVMPTGL